MMNENTELRRLEPELRIVGTAAIDFRNNLAASRDLCLTLNGAHRYHSFHYEEHSFDRIENRTGDYHIHSDDVERFAGLMNAFHDDFIRDELLAQAILECPSPIHFRRSWPEQFDLSRNTIPLWGYPTGDRPIANLVIAATLPHNLLYFNEDWTEDDMTIDIYDTLALMNRDDSRNFARALGNFYDIGRRGDSLSTCGDDDFPACAH